MSEKHFPYEEFHLAGNDLRDAVLAYASNPLYSDNEEWTNEDNPYRRQLRPQVLGHLDFGTPLGRHEILDYRSLAIQRALTCIYEADLMFLPKAGLKEQWPDFRRFYSATNRVLGERIRPALEQHAFGFLEGEIDVAGDWSPASLQTYLREAVETDSDQQADWEVAIEKSSDRERAARMWLVQFAPDFLSEASPMIRNVMGSYGPLQSEWFKIIVDEYGYGVHTAKHSTLFERTLESAGLRSDLHHYWLFYLTGSLMMNNYYHYLGKNHELFFRYLGALYYAESTLVSFCRRAADLLDRVFDGRVDTTYYTEHVHIDQHHGRMALENLVLPAVAAAGDEAIAEVLRGFEEVRLLGRLADDDFAAQIRWMDGGDTWKELHAPVWAAIESGRVSAPIADLVEPRGELSNTHCHDGDELCHIVSGTMRFVNGLDSYQILEPGQGTVIIRDRLHGAIIESEECVYQIHSVGDYQRCLS